MNTRSPRNVDVGNRPSRPDALVIGAPKAGTSALHAALARHEQVFVVSPKEPKYYMCTDAPPPAYNGPGDAHSQKEWVWRADDYASLFAGAPAESIRLESTPFYLYLPHSRRRIAEELPEAKLIVVVRDPIDRAYSNWMHLWVDGLEPIDNLAEAWAAEDHRVAAGWAPFWHYQRLGRYGEQLADLLTLVDRDRVLVLRYWQVVSRPSKTLDRVADFLGIRRGQLDALPANNSRPFVDAGLRSAVLGRVIRAGAAAGQFAPPQAWRRASRPLLHVLQHGGAAHRPALPIEEREALLSSVADDIGLLEETLGESFEDWRSLQGRGAFAQRAERAQRTQSVTNRTQRAHEAQRVMS